MNQSASFSAADQPAEIPPAYIVPSTTEVSNGVSARLNVGQDLRDQITPEQREAAIKKAGDLIVRYMALAEQGEYFHWRGMADRARMSMESLIKGRAADWKRPQERSLA
jgi:hypothetical protein